MRIWKITATINGKQQEIITRRHKNDGIPLTKQEALDQYVMGIADAGIKLRKIRPPIKAHVDSLEDITDEYLKEYRTKKERRNE